MPKHHKAEPSIAEVVCAPPVKVADNHYRKSVCANISGISINMTVDMIDGEPPRDMHMEMYGEFFIAGSKRKEFLKKLSVLISEYRI
ncbi:MAG: hypothetical protein A4E69_00271 [Syntrophus sp. PtaB.Bin138]|nr:MAG: hypothetical protein A4E69_00271 [Syntrophus sp. PtaB.Bin138]